MLVVYTKLMRYLQNILFSLMNKKYSDRNSK